MIYNSTYKNDELDNECEKIVGKKYNIIDSILLNGIGSKRLIVKKYSKNFIEIIEKPKFFTYCYFIITFLTFFWGMYAGTIIDRYSRKKIFLITNFICGTIIASVSAYGFYNQSTSEYLVILVFLITIFNYNVHYPNLYAFGQEITEKKN